jgi:hypothetical protein
MSTPSTSIMRRTSHKPQPSNLQIDTSNASHSWAMTWRCYSDHLWVGTSPTITTSTISVKTHPWSEVVKGPRTWEGSSHQKRMMKTLANVSTKDQLMTKSIPSRFLYTQKYCAYPFLHTFSSKSLLDEIFSEAPTCRLQRVWDVIGPHFIRISYWVFLFFQNWIVDRLLLEYESYVRDAIVKIA